MQCIGYVGLTGNFPLDLSTKEQPKEWLDGNCSDGKCIIKVYKNEIIIDLNNAYRPGGMSDGFSYKFNPSQITVEKREIDRGRVLFFRDIKYVITITISYPNTREKTAVLLQVDKRDGEKILEILNDW